ncbi:hypothetical protein [Bacillus cereus]|uniref:hypothetical protein n=1 Tax=Bacillus cereus TaxID=1396 RepID=UPI00027A8E46|nr:hypothetical protein [Bacillus cereus]EJS62879.1 hypothetical protein ICU_04816 [Bacillus cereus BAG2X1-1]EJS69803.1 hypothetical protein ICY_04562 [Bacillus cereus BAG2X1-3]
MNTKHVFHASKNIWKCLVKYFLDKGCKVTFTYFVNKKAAEELVEELQKVKYRKVSNQVGTEGEITLMISKNGNWKW